MKKTSFIIVSLFTTRQINAELDLKTKIAVTQARFTTKMSDAQALHYVETHGNSYVAVSFPCVKSKDDVLEHILQKYGKIVHKKKMELNNNGPFNLIRLCYKYDNYSQADCNTIYQAAFPEHCGIVIFYVFTCKNLERVRKAKSDIRKIYKVRGAIHATDYHYQSLDLARCVFSAEGIQFLCRNSPALNNFDDLNDYLRTLHPPR